MENCKFQSVYFIFAANNVSENVFCPACKKSGSEIVPCNRIHKQLVVYRF